MTGSLRFGSLVLLGLLSIYFYYILYPWHGEDKTYFTLFMFINILLYVCYKFIFLLFPKTKTQVHALHIISFFGVELFLLSLCFFGFQGQNITLAFFMFFKISCILLLLSFFWIVIYAFGRTILRFLDVFHEDEKIAFALTAFGIGFSLFGMILFFLGFFGWYTLPAVGGVFFLVTVFSYKKIRKIGEHLSTPFLEYEQKIDDSASFSEKINIGRVIDEIHLGIISFLLSINFINVYRPFPIGWDDLGVYMNYPRLLAQSGELLALGKMYFWELYTGLGFLAGSQMFAFFLNSFSGVMVALIVYFSLTALLGNKKTLFNIPLFAVVILLSMPMTVFQLAKDMKLDYGLLGISVIALFLLYHMCFSQHHKNTRQRVLLFGILGFLIGIAFSLKVTSLLLLLGAFGVIFYVHFSLLGFLGFLFLFFGSFTFLNIWGMMNIILPEISSSTKTVFSLSSMFLGVSSVYVSYIHTLHKHKNIKHFLQEITMILVGFCIALLPWGIKHTIEVPADQAISIGTLLNGVADQYIPKYELLYTAEKIAQKQDQLSTFSNQGKVNNEDFGRYFGYEEGINNYLKLPWNLTYQVNQKGEFTDISFIFFALIPLIFLFLPFRKQIYMFPIIVAELLLLVYYIPNPLGLYLTQVFSQIQLPGGYIVIFLFFLLPYLYLFFTLDRSQKLVQMFLVNFTFSSVYVLLWSVSSFGIVWYGILMYYIFLFMIALSLEAAHESDKEMGYIGIYTVLATVWIYMLLSVIPHGVTNLATAGYSEYKLGEYTEEFSLMSFHPDYFPVLFMLNISGEKQEQIFREYKDKFLTVVQDLPDAQDFIATVQSLQNTLQLVDVVTQLGRYNISPEVDKQLIQIRQELYERVMNTPKDFKNDAIIYRAGTFLKYFISENHRRVFEDSLLISFHNYLYDTDTNTTFDRFQKLGLSYILLDLNAATIDQDPAKNLTKRYEDMLLFLTSEKLQLIESDSVCLKLALDVYKQTADTNIYLSLAGVNYGIGNLKQQKHSICVDTIATLLFEKKVSIDTYPYLLIYQNAFPQLKINPEDLNAIRSGIASYVQSGYKALFQLKK